MGFLKRILNSFVFWGAWIIIPVVMEIIPALVSIFLLLRRRRRVTKQKAEKPAIYPEISIIVPVYNSEDTLFSCIESIYNSTYPTDSIRVFLVNNQGQDDSFSVFAACQQRFPELRMQWLNAEQGKSRALNLALYNSEGKYIINLDSDGTLEPSALTNMVDRFEVDPDLNCMTGTVLTNADEIKKHKGFFARLLRNLEFMEYAQAFLAGRSYASETNTLYTLSGAFSAFRKSAILQSWMYNTDTVSEDTHLTFQMRKRQKERVEVCEDAIFFVDPIESVNKLYTQRQRWQRGSLEVAKMFMDDDFKMRKLLTDVSVKTLLYDHTFAFPRMIWYLAMLCLIGLQYSSKAVVVSTGLIFSLYILIGFLYFIASVTLLRMDPELQKYYRRHWWCIFLMPFYNLMTFFLRLFGIVNSIKTDSAWQTKDLTREKQDFVTVLKTETARIRDAIRKIRGSVNRKPQPPKQEKSDPVGWSLSVGALYLIGILLILVTYWSRKAFGVGIAEIIATLMGPLEGTGGGMINEVIVGFVLPLVGLILLLSALITGDILLSRHLEKKQKKGTAYRIFHSLVAMGGVAVLLFGLLYGNAQYQLLDYYAVAGTKSTIYEDYYVDPGSVEITAAGKPKNLIYIYVESLETTYASVEDGGFQEINYMPAFTALAHEGINFADVDNMGGSHAVAGTTWTIAALLASTSGVPHALPADSGEGEYQFLPGLTNLGDILAEKGYRQMFICGSDTAFARRKEYFTQHGNYEIFDVYTAREKGYVPEDYWHNWGVEDKVLFEIAREELTAMAAQEGPFNFTLLTVDLHATNGYICQWCDDKFEGITRNVIDCNDHIVPEFIRWCQQQDFYKDSVIVITGDHPRMDSNLIEGVPYYDRTVYHTILNSDTVCQLPVKSRTYTILDLFPTTLAAMGFEIQGDRLGLGVNLFSAEKTLAEEKGFSWLDGELSKSSEFYLATFAPHLKGKASQGEPVME